VRMEEILMTFKVRQVLIKSIRDETVITEQWQATVYDNGRRVYRSTGYNYVSEARNAALTWIESRRKT
jgi:hypothetical protein